MVYKKVTTSTNNVFSGIMTRVHRILLVGGSDAASVVLYDAATAATVDFCTLHTALNTEKDFSWGSNGLVVNYVSVTLTGTNSILYIYYS